MLFAVGKSLDARARASARAALGDLGSLHLGPVSVVRSGTDLEVAPDDLEVGDLVVLRPGDEIPADGRVESGRSFVDTALLTGEEQPASAGPGDRVLAGTRLVDGTLTIRAEAVHGHRLRDEVERLLEGAALRRASIVRLSDRLAGALLPLVLVAAVATVFLHWSTGRSEALFASLSVLLISCPCALGIATPLAYWVATGSAWRRGALVRGGDVFERLARARKVFLDKTGTLTTGELELVEVRPAAGQGARRARAPAARGGARGEERAPRRSRGRARAWRARAAGPRA